MNGKIERRRMYGYGNHPEINKYIRKHQCRKLMEIGVADGDNAKNMVETAMKNFPPEKIEYYGFDIFSPSKKPALDPKLNTVKEKLAKTGCHFILFKGDSKETLPKEIDGLPTMDLLFIDGGHDHHTVKSDWEHSKKLMKPHTIVFFHNANWSGPQKLIQNISREKYIVKLFDPPSNSPMALVKRRD